MNIIPLPQPTPPTPAERGALSILAHVNSAAAQAVERQKMLYGMFWDNAATPDELLEQMGDNAIRMLAAAGESVRHLTALAEIAGVQLPELIDLAFVLPRREFVVTDSVVTLAPPADGFDAWGCIIPPPPEPVEEDEPIEPEE